MLGRNVSSLFILCSYVVPLAWNPSVCVREIPVLIYCTDLSLFLDSLFLFCFLLKCSQASTKWIFGMFVFNLNSFPIPLEKKKKMQSALHSLFQSLHKSIERFILFSFSRHDQSINIIMSMNKWSAVRPLVTSIYSILTTRRKFQMTFTVRLL